MIDVAQSLPWRTAIDLVTEEEREILWRAGQLFWLLHGDQADAYRRYRAWEIRADRSTTGLYKRLWVFDCGRRWGKDWECIVIKLEDCLRRPGSVHTYATAFAKDITEIVIPLMRQILATCPEDIRPVYRTTRMGETNGFYFPTGSVLKLVGIDKNPDGLRGRGSDGVVVTEAGYVSKLEETVASVIYPQFQGRPHARLILQSTAPATPNHAYDKVFLSDAKLREAWCFRTIDDNPMLDAEEREHFIAAAGGRDHPRCRREYFGERVRDPSSALVPEFDPRKHVVQTIPSPEWAATYVGADPGMADLCGIVWAFWDPVRAKLCVQRAWAERNRGTKHVAGVWLDTERELWAPNGQFPGTRWWDGTGIRLAPYGRVSDTDLRLLSDLQSEHGINISKADKRDDKEASMYFLRDWFANDKIEIAADGASLLVEHLLEGKWNKNRTDYDRSEQYGHFDLVDALRYLVRHVDRAHNPRPPEWVLDPTLAPNFFAPDFTRASSAAGALNRTFARKNAWHR
jgi:hypothetical protein